MTAKEIKQRLHELQDEKYRDFQRRLEPETHRRAIQKAIESNRISGLRKEYLRTLK